MNRIVQNRLLAIAAAVVFFALLALFAAVTALAFLYGIFAREETIGGRLSFLAGIMPAGVYSIVQEQISRIVAKGEVRLGCCDRVLAIGTGGFVHLSRQNC
jgi:membrane protein